MSVSTGTRWLLHQERSDKRHSTGVPGISLVQSARNRRDGTLQRFFSVSFRGARGQKLRRRYCWETLGKEEAWRRAVVCRAAYEQSLQGGAA